MSICCWHHLSALWNKTWERYFCDLNYLWLKLIGIDECNQKIKKGVDEWNQAEGFFTFLWWVLLPAFLDLPTASPETKEIKLQKIHEKLRLCLKQMIKVLFLLLFVLIWSLIFASNLQSHSSFLSLTLLCGLITIVTIITRVQGSLFLIIRGETSL